MRKYNICDPTIEMYFVKYILKNGENAGYQHFLLFPQCFQEASCIGSLKVVIVWERVDDWKQESY